MHAHPLPADPGLFFPLVYGLASLLWLVEVLERFGPSWNAVGPILMGVAAIYHGKASLVRAHQSR